MSPRISVSVKAVIVRGSDILLLSYSGSSFHYNLPGGKATEGESLTGAVERKVLNETGLAVTCGPLLLVVEYVPAYWDYEFKDVQKLQFQFAVREVDSSQQPTFSQPKDPRQIGFTWVPIADLNRIPLLPRIGLDLQAALRGDQHRLFVDRW